MLFAYVNVGPFLIGGLLVLGLGAGAALAGLVVILGQLSGRGSWTRFGRGFWIWTARLGTVLIVLYVAWFLLAIGAAVVERFFSLT